MFEMRAKMISVGLLGAAILLPIDDAGADQLGHASWYSLPSNITANGERMDPNELTAAHRSLPFGTKVLVENLANGRSVVVRINDRGPFIGGRIIDLSQAAAASIGMIDAGTAKVRVIAADGSALAALGEATAKAKAETKTGVAATAKAKTDVSETAAKATAVASKPSQPKSVAAKASAGTLGVAKRLEAQGKVQVANAPRRALLRNRFAAAASDGIRTAAYQASDLSDQRFHGSSDHHPYPMLSAMPGFLKPSRTRRFG
jgi:rare lipoprotein A